MPQSLAASMLTLALVGAGAIVLSMMSSNESAEPAGRRWFRRRRDAPSTDETDDQKQEPDDEAVADTVDNEIAPDDVDAISEPEDPIEYPLARGRDKSLDHVPLGPAKSETLDEQQTRLRDKFRRGLRQTRDYLNRDVREVFGAGPIPETFDALEEILVQADVSVSTAVELSDELRERGRELTSDTLPGAFKESMRALLAPADRKLSVNPGLSVWLIVGVNGTGKTTTIAKLASHALGHGFSVCLAAADTFRAAAIEQLQVWGKRLKVDVVAQRPGSDPGAVVFDAIAHAQARGHDLLIVDTAGRLHSKTPLMEELRKIRRVIDRQDGLLTECLLVMDATTGQNGIAQARAFGEAVNVTGLVLAKLDGTAKGGITFSVERELATPVKAVGLGEKATDLAEFDPDVFVDALFKD